MKIKDLSVDFIMSLNEEALQEVRWCLKPALTGTRKALKKLEVRPITTDREAKEYAGIRRAKAHQEEMLEAIMCRQDELYGPGVLSTYDHSEMFV